MCAAILARSRRALALTVTTKKKLLLKLAGTENLLILAVNVLAVKFWLLKLVVPVELRVFFYSFIRFVV